MSDPVSPSPRSTGATDQAGLLAHLGRLAREDRLHLYRFVYKRVRDPVEAEDITQQAFVEAVAAVDRFRADAELRTWVYGIALKLIANHLRRAPHRRYRFESEEILLEHPSDTGSPADLCERQELLARVERHLAALPDEMRRTVFAVLLDDVSYVDAAVQFCVPVGTVRSRVCRARALLRQGLAADGIDDPCQ